MAHALTTNLGLRDLNATTLTNNALVADTLVLTALALPVTGRAKDTLTEKAVLFWLQGAVVDGLRLLNLALRPTANVVGGGQSNTKLVEEIYVEHVTSPFHPPESEEVDWLLVLINVSSIACAQTAHDCKLQSCGFRRLRRLALVKRCLRKSSHHGTG